VTVSFSDTLIVLFHLLYLHGLGPSLLHNLQLTFLAANAMQPSGNGLSPLLGIYPSTEDSVDHSGTATRAMPHTHGADLGGQPPSSGGRAADTSNTLIGNRARNAPSDNRYVVERGVRNDLVADVDPQ